MVAVAAPVQATPNTSQAQPQTLSPEHAHTRVLATRDGRRADTRRLSVARPERPKGGDA